MMRRHTAPTLWTVAMLGVTACARRPPLDPCPAAAAGGPPVLVAVRPDSIPLSLVLEERAVVTLVGCAFGVDPVRVAMGPATVHALQPTDDGTRVRFPVPPSISSGGEAPPMPTPAGTYDVVIITDRGRSGARILTVY